VKDTAVSMPFEGQACSNFAQSETQIIYNLTVFIKWFRLRYLLSLNIFRASQAIIKRNKLFHFIIILMNFD